MNPSFLRKATAAMGAAVDSAVDRVDRVADRVIAGQPPTPSRAQAPATPTHPPSAAQSPAPSTSGGPRTPHTEPGADKPSTAAAAAAASSADSGVPDLTHVPKSDVVALCVKTGRRLKALEMQYAELKAMHQTLLDEKRQRLTAAGTRQARRGAGGAGASSEEVAALHDELDALKAEKEAAIEAQAAADEQHLLAVSRAQQQRELAARADAHSRVLLIEMGNVELMFRHAEQGAAALAEARRKDESRFLERVMALQAELATLRVSARAQRAGAAAAGASGGGAAAAGAAAAAGSAAGAEAADSADSAALRTEVEKLRSQAEEREAFYAQKVASLQAALDAAEARSLEGDREKDGAAAELASALKAERAAAAAAAHTFHAQLSAEHSAKASAQAEAEGLRAELAQLKANADEALHEGTAHIVAESARERQRLYARIETLGSELEAAKDEAEAARGEAEASSRRLSDAESRAAHLAEQSQGLSSGREQLEAALAAAESALGAESDARRAAAAEAERAQEELRSQLAAAADLASERAREAAQWQAKCKQLAADRRAGGALGRAGGCETRGASAAAAAAHGGGGGHDGAASDGADARARAASANALADSLRTELAAEQAASAKAAEAARQTIAQLRSELGALKEEVSASGLGEVQVMRYAHMQAQRDEEHTRLRGQVTKLRRMLLESHAMLKRLNEQDGALKAEVARLNSVRACAETLNIEYLKNVMVKFLEIVFIDSEATEITALVRVIETALHFTADERERVNRAMEQGDSGMPTWWAKSFMLG